MNHNSIARFYQFELRLQLTGRLLLREKELSQDEKNQIKQEKFNQLYHSNSELKSKYSLKSMIDFLRNNDDVSHTTSIYKAQIKNFSVQEASEQCFAGLFFYANRNLQANDFYDFELDKERKIEQKETEAVRLISHMVMRLVKNKISGEDHLYVALEARSFITPNQVCKTLNHLLKQWTTNILFEDRSINVYPRLEVQAFKSETLEDMLKTGTLKGIQLIKNSVVNDSQDGIPFSAIGRNEMIFTLPKKIKLNMDEQLNGVKKVIKVKKDEFDSLKVTIDLGGTTKTNEYHFSDYKSDEDLLQEFFFHKAVLEFKNGIIDANYSRVIGGIVDKVINEVLSDEKLKFFN
ncbi:hypothetical protein [Legionella sp.]|uniref:hypothetical protein n=1 Tax=Legionella sp. TaxID=459 RepID=UPI003CAE3358